MLKTLKKYGYVFVLFIVVLAFFYQFFLRGLLPIPADTIIGLYNPFRDLYVKDYPRGLPYKNFLITDPVRQQYPWKNLAINLEKKLELPLWNPYSFSGTPLLANFQSSPFYPLNAILFIPPFPISWSVFILLEPVLAGLFLYLYLKNLKLSSIASLFGGITFAFSGFFVAWLEWGTIVHTALWLPLVLLSIDKIVSTTKYHVLSINAKVFWSIIYLFAIISSFLAGHLQIFFYTFLFSVLYTICRIVQIKKKVPIIVLFIILNSCFIILSLPQLLPTLQFITLSSRTLDQSWIQAGWFIPYQNFAQFITPDFFGNPATLNYYGVWNYAEFIGYVGVGALILATYAVVTRRDKKTYFFLATIVIATLFATQNLISQTPFQLEIPFISSAQPTRLLFIIDVSLAILAALGLDYFIKKKKQIWIPIAIIGMFLLYLWITVFTGKQLFPNIIDIEVAKNNLKLPSLLFVLSAALLLGIWKIKDKNISQILLWGFMLVLLFDLFRFGWKFTPFTSQTYLYPSTKITTYLQKQPGIFRIAAASPQILPPNFSIMYKLQSIEGYDPLYLSNYAGFIAAMERGKPDISAPYGFNRIITPNNYNSPLFDLLNVKYVLSFDKLPESKFEKVMQEGQTKVYRNKTALSRVFFVSQVIPADSKQDVINKMYTSDLEKTAVAEGLSNRSNFVVGEVKITKYRENEVVLQTINKGQGYLVLTDAFYPTWKVYVDNKQSKIYSTNYAFRGVVIPAGSHIVRFATSLF